MKLYVVDRGTHCFTQLEKCSSSGPILNDATFHEKELVSADLAFMTFKRGFINYTFHPDDVRVTNDVL